MPKSTFNLELSERLESLSQQITSSEAKGQKFLSTYKLEGSERSKVQDKVQDSES